MNKSLNLFLLSCCLLALLSGCNRSQSAAVNNPNAAIANPTVSPNANAALTPEPTRAANSNVSDGKTSNDDTDIKSCSPEELYLGETLTVNLRQPHGNYAAIQRISDKKWFFLNDAERSEPVWSRAEFKMLSIIKINVDTAVNTTNSETAEKIFNRTGKYRFMVSDQDFGQEDPLVTGICEVEYFHRKRPKQ